MKILLIGNGFDLEHHLPTTYRDFLSFCRKAGKIFTNFPRVSVQEFRENELKDWTVNPYIKEILDSAYHERKCEKTWSNNVWRDEVTTPYPELDELYANMKDNAWLNYFWECPSYLGENWIDFESEISKVIQAMEDWRAQVEDGHSIAGISLSERNLLAAIVNASDAEFQDLFEEDVTAVDRYSEYLRRELDRLTRALEIYLAGFVQKIEIDGKSADIENLQPGHVLSFNYSNTYERVYGQGRKIVYDYIHGKAKLAGGVAVVNVGAATEVELKEKKHRVEDALSATRAAIEEGVIPGGGVALVQAVNELAKKDLSALSEEEKVGYRIVIRALEEPIRQIAENAGVDGSIIADKCKSEKQGVGYDANAMKWVNMVESGIIDPVKVTRSALQNAASIASLILTTECAVTDIPAPEPAAPANPGMGGMM